MIGNLARRGEQTENKAMEQTDPPAWRPKRKREDIKQALTLFVG